MVQRNLVNGSRRRFTVALLMLACCSMAAELITMARVAAADAADEPDGYAVSACIVEMAGVKGGLVIHLGCGDGRLTAALRVNERYLVQGLDVDPENVKRARETVRRLGLYGPVSVDQWSGEQLPYADNLVRLMVISVPQAVSRDEILRVLCPGGVAVSVEAGGRDIKKTLVKPWPADIDQWTHHLHDSGGNAVARDTVVGPPRHLQWTAGPLWSRSHGWTPSVSAMVSANGRLFYLCDETLTCVDGTVPDRWFLTARDAFSGVLLWKRAGTAVGLPVAQRHPRHGRRINDGAFHDAAEYRKAAGCRR